MIVNDGVSSTQRYMCGRAVLRYGLGCKVITCVFKDSVMVHEPHKVSVMSGYVILLSLPPD